MHPFARDVKWVRAWILNDCGASIGPDAGTKSRVTGFSRLMEQSKECALYKYCCLFEIAWCNCEWVKLIFNQNFFKI